MASFQWDTIMKKQENVTPNQEKSQVIEIDLKKKQKSKTPTKKTDDWIHSQGFLSSYYKYVEIKG